MCQATAADCQATAARPSSVATQRGTCSVCASSAVPTHTNAVVAPYSAPAAAQATSEPGRRRPASCPTMAPASAPANSALRNLCVAGRMSARRRSTGASITKATSGASNARGPPCAPPRMPAMKAMATRRPSTAGPCCSTLAAVDSFTLPSLTELLIHRMDPPPKPPHR